MTAVGVPARVRPPRVTRILPAAAGRLLRLETPPLVVVAMMTLLVVVSPKVTATGNAYGRLSPLSTDTLGSGSGAVFRPFVPGMSIVQLMFYGGIALAVAGATGLPASAGGRRLRAIAAAVTVAGLAATGTGVGLAGTSYPTANGVVVPALYGASSGRPVPYAPACERAGSGIPVCVHPAFASYLPALSAALDPLLGEVAGLPGAPARVTQAASLGMYVDPGMDATISGSPPVLQLAVMVPTDTVPLHRYTTANTRHAWLAANLPALHAGQVTLAQLP